MFTSTICTSIRHIPSCFQPADHTQAEREEHVPLFAPADPSRPPTLIGSLVVNDTPGPESLIADFLGDKELAALAHVSKGFQALGRQSKVYASTVYIYPQQSNIQHALQKYLKKDDQNNLVPNTRVYKLDLCRYSSRYRYKPLNDADLQFVATFFPHLNILNLSGYPDITDDGLAYVGRLNNLQHLSFSHCNRITHKGLALLQPLRNLKNLSLSRCSHITNDGLSQLKPLLNLQHLNLTECELITDKGLAYLIHLPNLKDLDFSGCKLITDKGLAYLIHLPNLKHLRLSRCELITEAGVAGFAVFKPRTWIFCESGIIYPTLLL